MGCRGLPVHKFYFQCNACDTSLCLSCIEANKKPTPPPEPDMSKYKETFTRVLQRSAGEIQADVEKKVTECAEMMRVAEKELERTDDERPTREWLERMLLVESGEVRARLHAEIEERMDRINFEISQACSCVQAMHTCDAGALEL